MAHFLLPQRGQQVAATISSLLFFLVLIVLLINLQEKKKKVEAPQVERGRRGSRETPLPIALHPHPQRPAHLLSSCYLSHLSRSYLMFPLSLSFTCMRSSIRFLGCVGSSIDGFYTMWNKALWFLYVLYKLVLLRFTDLHVN
jgi:hypothetical protein